MALPLVETTKCLNPYMNGIRGLIVERRRNSFLVLTQNGAIKVVPRNQCWFYIYRGNCIKLEREPPLD
ncbi:MAG: ribonuclease P protein subunit [Thermocladium sp.]